MSDGQSQIGNSDHNKFIFWQLLYKLFIRAHFMKNKIKKHRHIISLQQKSASRLAQMALHQQSQNQQYNPFINTFVYAHMQTLNQQSQLSTWNPNRTLCPNNTISESTARLQVKKKKISFITQAHFNRTKYLTQHHSRLCKQTITKSKEERQERIKKRKISTSKVRCAISLINPKFDEKIAVKPIQTQRYLKSINSHNFSTQKKETTREKGSLIIKKIKRDVMNGLQFKLKNKRSKTSSTQIDHQTNREQTLPYSKRYTEIQLKFNSSFVEQRQYKQEENYSSRMSNLLTQRNERYARGKTLIKRQRKYLQLHENSQIGASQEFIKLRCLLSQQKIEKI